MNNLVKGKGKKGKAISTIRIEKRHCLLGLTFYFLLFFFSSCGVYKFTDASVDPRFKTIRIQQLDNRAPYVNPQLSPGLTERLRRKIVNQTKLSTITGDNAHYDVTGYVSDYSVSTTGISNKNEVTNRLTVTVHITVNNQLDTKKEEFDITRNYEFPASYSLQQAENNLFETITRDLSDDIFNRMFSNW